jgi:hypothetical protein
MLRRPNRCVQIPSAPDVPLGSRWLAEMEQLDYNLLFRWFAGTSADEQMWVPAVFTKNRERRGEARHRGKFLRAAAEAGRPAPVGRTLHRRWHADRGGGVAEKLPRKDDSDDGNGANFHGTQRKNDTHQSTTDSDAKPYRKSNAESKLSSLGHTLGSDAAFPRASTRKFFRRWRRRWVCRAVR